MLMYLYGLQRLTSSRIAKELGTDTETVVKLFRELRRDGIVLKPDIEIGVMGLRREIVVLRNVVPDFDRLDMLGSYPFVRSITYAFPDRTVLVLATSKCREVPRAEVAVCVERCYGCRAVPSLLYAAKRLEMRRLLDARSIDDGEIAVATPRRSRLDWIDLEILQLLSMHPEYTLLRLSIMLKRRMRSIEYHVRHAENVITGYRVAQIKSLYRHSPISFLIVATCRNPDAVCLRVVRHPMVVSCGVGRSKNVVVQIRTPLELAHAVPKLFSELAPECSVEFALTLSLARKYVATVVGSKTTGEYSSKIGWREVDVEKAIEELKKKGILVPLD